MSQYHIIEEVMTGLFEQLIKNNDEKDNGDGLHFCVHIDAESYGYEKDGNTHHEDWVGRHQVYVHYIFAKHSSVYECVSLSRNMPDPESFKNISNHDSCWRSSMNLASIGFEVWDKGFYNVPDEHKPATKDCDIRYSLTPLLTNVFREVKIRFNFNEEDDYFRDLTSIEVVK